MYARVPDWLPPIVAGAIVTLLSGCAGAKFVVDAGRDRPAEPRHQVYHIVPGNAALHPDDPVFMMVADYVRAALSSKGLVEAGPGSSSGMVVEISFQAEPPRVETWTQTEDITVVVAKEIVTKTKKVRQPDGSKVKQTVTKVVPAHTEKAGERTRTNTVTLYPKYLRVTARGASDTALPGPMHRLWFVDVTNEDQTDQFESYLVLMVAAAMDHLGETLDRPRTISISIRNRRTQFILRGGDPPPGGH